LPKLQHNLNASTMHNVQMPLLKLWHNEKCYGTMKKAVAKCHIMPQHKEKHAVTMCNATCNAAAGHAMQQHGMHHYSMKNPWHCTMPQHKEKCHDMMCNTATCHQTKTNTAAGCKCHGMQNVSGKVNAKSLLHRLIFRVLN